MQPPPPEDDLEPTVAMHVTEPPPPHTPAPLEPPLHPHVEQGVVEAGPPPRDAILVSPAITPPAPVAGTHVPAAAPAAVRERPRYVFGNPVGYVGARFAAFVLDVVLVTVFVTAFAYSPIAINPLTGLPTDTQRGFDATLAIGVAVALVYVWVCEAFFGTTIWKLAFGLHVYASRGGMVGLVRAFVRNLLRPLDLFLIGGILALLPGHRRLGDLVSGTVVARSPLRGFAPLVGWILILLLCGLPFAIIGPLHTFAALVAFVKFTPGLIARLWLLVQTLLGLPH